MFNPTLDRQPEHFHQALRHCRLQHAGASFFPFLEQTLLQANAAGENVERRRVKFVQSDIWREMRHLRKKHRILMNGNP